jgi:putative membrane protein
MKMNVTGFACVMAAVCVMGCNKLINHNGNNNLSQMDRDFMTQASYANNGEVAAGGVAVVRAMDTAVKAFGAFMVTEHTAAQTELQAIADSIMLPTTPDSAHVMLVQKLQTLSGHTFDTAYVKSQVDDHKKALVLFEQEADYGGNTKLRNYAAANLPHLRLHLQLADSLWARLNQ